MTDADTGAPEAGGRAGAVMMDVARLAGVSKQTVSRVFNDQPKVRAETRERVLAAARQLGFRPNPTARALVTGRTRTLGVITSDATSYGPAATLQGICAAARDAGYFVSAAPLRSPDRPSVLETVDRLVGQSVDGIIVIASQKSVARALADAPHKVPMVTLDHSFEEGTPVVTVGEEQAAHQATRHLLQLGHRTVWHIAGPPDSIAAEGRIRGWQAALRDAGAPVPAPLVGDWTAGSGYALGLAITRHPEVTAVLAANDQMAMGLLRALNEAGRRVPAQVSVIGFDDIPEAAYMIPPLTTVRHNFAEVGRSCLALMIDQLENPPRSWVRSVIASDLIVRTSSGPPPH
ncbi:LacI family DNA-binding transcriptional regulator [Streptacidiphilus sp. EB103A]|uniref:LacI family DNA-binding transcriptional regulator n=1 Tax=Streptacidiphilus sp. EB103A TaxID=3156275 RepID=UPI0035110C35